VVGVRDVRAARRRDRQVAASNLADENAAAVPTTGTVAAEPATAYERPAAAPVAAPVDAPVEETRSTTALHADRSAHEEPLDGGRP
ncbi:MAG TPA: hypothetical protein VGH11_03720, partial [Jatrophihabitans sp.]